MPSEDCYQRIVAIDNLRSAWVKARHYAQTEEFYFDLAAYRRFAEHLEAKLASLQHELLDCTYRASPLRQVVVPKGEDIRRLYFLNPRDSVVIQAAMNVVGPDFEAGFSQDSYGNRLGVGEDESHQAYRRWQDLYGDYVSAVRRFLNEGAEAWYLITDIEDCYPSVKLERLRGLLAAGIHDERALELVSSFLGLEAFDSHERLQSVQGLPPGALHAHFFANIYLTELDNLAAEHTKGYARYVDDICFVCGDEATLREAEDRLRRYLERWEHGLKEDKTIRRPVSDWEPLIDHTRKLKYARRLDLMAALDTPSQDIQVAADAEALLRDLYMVVETSGDVDKLVGDAGFVVGQLGRLGVSDLESVIYSLLEVRPLRPSTMRVLMGCLLELELPDPSPRFQLHLTPSQEDGGYLRVSMLQLLPFFSTRAAGIKDLLLEDLCRDANYLVRAAAYMALRALAERGALSVTVEELRDLREAEESPYALERLIDCYSVAEGDNAWVSLVSVLTSEGPRYAGAVAGVVCDLLTSQRMQAALLETVFPPFEQVGHLDSRTCVYLLYMTTRFGASWMVSRVLECARARLGPTLADELFSIIVSEVIEEMAMSGELGRLLQFSEQVEMLGFGAEATLGLGEVIGRTTEVEILERASTHRDAAGRVAVSSELPDWYVHDPQCQRGRYRESRGDRHYLCLAYDSEATGRVGTLELISAARLAEGGFHDLDEWFAYLDRLRADGVVSVIDKGAYREAGLDKVFSLYEQPPGFRTLAQWLNDPLSQGLFTVPAVVKLSLALLEAMRRTSEGAARLVSVDPLDVLWSPAESRVMLLNLGSSLRIPTYQCGVPDCAEPYSLGEIGPSAATYSLGLLILQLLTRQCPIQIISSTRSRHVRRVSLDEVLDIPGISPHLRQTLGRMLQKVPDYRYTHLSWLKTDLEDSLAWELCQQEQAEADQATVAWRTLSDFLEFRLGIVSRNPDFRARPAILRVVAMLSAVSDSLRYLPEDMLSLWNTSIRLRSPTREFPSAFQARRLSPEGRRLVGIAEGWERRVTSERSENQWLSPLSKLCLYHTLAVEASSCVSGLVSGNGDVPEDRLALAREVVLQLMSELRDRPSAIFAVRPVDQPSAVIRVALSSEDLQQMQEFLLWLRGDYTAYYGFRAISLKAVGTFLTLCTQQCDVLRGRRVVARSVPVLPAGDRRIGVESLWQLLKDFSALDGEIAAFARSVAARRRGHRNGRTRRASEVWARIPEMLRLLRALSPARRWAAELYSYDYWAHEGLVRLCFPRSDRLTFREPEVFVSGYLIKDRDANRPVRVDVLLPAGAGPRKVCSVLAPSPYFRRLPLSTRLWSPSAVARWMRAHPYWTRVVLTTVGLGLPSVLAWVGIAVLGVDVPRAFVALADILAVLLLNLLGSSIERALATWCPEQAQLVE